MLTTDIIDHDNVPVGGFHEPENGGIKHASIRIENFEHTAHPAQVIGYVVVLASLAPAKDLLVSFEVTVAAAGLPSCMTQ